ncbi:hypothetical protein BJY17_000940 [Agromyces hippuratus]|uniref:Uncharacterized protein n=1 Tax=Agromyces hippuratus TaxID=286438 RepID=A0A852WW61_9MICO|nr:hypothetical protein [Agromyces hippuratus]
MHIEGWACRARRFEEASNPIDTPGMRGWIRPVISANPLLDPVSL